MIKYLLALFLITPAALADEESSEILMGSLTTHWFTFGASEHFSNKLTDSGNLIFNPMIGYRRVIFDSPNSYHSWLIFGGENSIGEAMEGGAASVGIGDKYLRIGMIAGTYLQDEQKFYDRGIQTIGVQVHDTMVLTPIIGLEVVYNIDLSPRTYFTINSLLAPTLYTAAVGIGWRL